MKRRHQQPHYWHPIIFFLWKNNCIFDTSLYFSLVVLSLLEYIQPRIVQWQKSLEKTLCIVFHKTKIKAWCNSRIDEYTMLSFLVKNFVFIGKNRNFANGPLWLILIIFYRKFSLTKTNDIGYNFCIKA